MKSDTASLLSPTKDTHFFGFELERILTLRSIGTEPGSEAEYRQSLAHRTMDFLGCIINPHDENLTCEIRLISHPDPDVPVNGTVDFALLFRRDASKATAVNEFALEVGRLLTSYFDEHEFRRATPERLRALLQPFSARHAVALNRRVELECVQASRHGQARRRMGFTTGETPRAARPDTVFLVLPFANSHRSYNTLLRLLLAQTESLAVSIRLRPSVLDKKEALFLEQQITRCENMGKGFTAPSPGQADTLITLSEPLRVFQRLLRKKLFGLRENAALLTIEVLSEKPVPPTVIDTVGALVTLPAAHGHERDLRRDLSEEGTWASLAGGFEIEHIRGTQVRKARAAFETLGMHLPKHPRGGPPVGRLVHLFDFAEACAAFRLPPSTVERPHGFEAQDHRVLPTARNMPASGTTIGYATHRLSRQTVRISPQDRRRHVYAVGQTGTGKSTLLKRMIIDDMRNGEGLCLIDPHGDLFGEVLERVPESRRDDVVILDPTDEEYPIGLNLLETTDSRQRHFVAQELYQIIHTLTVDEFGSYGLSTMGPAFAQQVRMNALLVMSDPDLPGTLMDLYGIFTQPDYWQNWRHAGMSDPQLYRWLETLKRIDYLRMGSDNSVSWGQYVGSKLEPLVFDPRLQIILGQRRSSLNLREIMDSGKILLVNLAKGELADANARFLGMALMCRFYSAAMSRIAIPESQRRNFNLYVDEFQSLATETFVTLLSEARKFGVSLVLANQFLSQVENRRIRDAIFGNVGTIVSFRVGHEDAALLEPRFLPLVCKSDLVYQPNWSAYVSMLINGQAAAPFSIATLLPDGPPATERAAAIRAQSRVKYGVKGKPPHSQFGGVLRSLIRVLMALAEKKEAEIRKDQSITESLLAMVEAYEKETTEAPSDGSVDKDVPPQDATASA